MSAASGSLESLLDGEATAATPRWLSARESTHAQVVRQNAQRFAKALAADDLQELWVGPRRWQPQITAQSLRTCLAVGQLEGLYQRHDDEAGSWSLLGTNEGVLLTVAEQQVGIADEIKGESLLLDGQMLRAEGAAAPLSPISTLQLQLMRDPSSDCALFSESEQPLLIAFPADRGQLNTSVVGLGARQLAQIVIAASEGASKVEFAPNPAQRLMLYTQERPPHRWEMELVDANAMRILGLTQAQTDDLRRQASVLQAPF